MRTLNAKLSVVLLVLLLSVGTATAVLTLRTSHLYLLEVQQKLHADLAAKVLEEEPFLQDAVTRDDTLDRIFDKLMVINPDIEIYLLDAEGRILGYSAPPGRVKRDTVELAPVRAFLAAEARLPILGTDPRNPDAGNIFSVAPIGDSAAGYLYIVLASEQLDSVASMLAGSYILRTGIGMVVGSLLLALVGGLLLFHRVTRRLRDLSAEIATFDAHASPSEEAGDDHGARRAPPADGVVSVPSGSRPPLRARLVDEIDALERGFADMRRRISRQLAELEARDKERRDLIVNLSHDVRTPLTHLQGYLETMSMKGEKLPPGERQEYLQIAVQRSEQLGRLVADLLELANFDAPRGPLRKEEFSVAELVQDVAQPFRRVAAERGIELEVNIATASARVCGNLGAIERALQNLIENAVRYSRRGDRIEVIVRRNEHSVEIAICDTGPGIASDELEHVFDRFYRCRARAGGIEEGSGLGLSIAKRALELHDADLVCESRAGEGTTFRFALACVDGGVSSL